MTATPTAASASGDTGGRARRWPPAALAGAALLLAFALLYLFTLDNGLRPEELQGGDLITHQYAQVQGRPSNAPGYPLYTMGGWLWFRAGRLILGADHNPIPILSSYSTLWALLALWLLYRLILEITAATGPDGRRTGGNWPIALLATAFYGVTYFFWYYAVTTEQYTSSVAWTLAAVLLAFRWDRTRDERTLLGLALLTGVGLAHQITILAVIPPLLWFVLRREPGLLRRPKLIAAALGLALLPLLSYAYVYVRGAAHPEWRGVGQWASAWDWFLSFVSTQQGRSELTWSWSPFFTDEFPLLMVREMTLPALIAGLAGWIALGRRRAAVFYGTLAIYLVFCWIDRLGNWYQVIMPVYALLVVGLAAGVQWLWGAPRGAAARGGIVLALLAAIAYRGALSYPRALSRDQAADTGLAPGWAIVADAPAQPLVVVGTTPETLALNYLTQIWGRRPDLRAATVEQARAALAAGETVAVTRAALPLAPTQIASDAHYTALGSTLIRISRAPLYDLPAGWADAPTGPDLPHDFGAELRLLQVRGGREPAAGAWVARLAWQARVQPGQDWAVSVRPTRDGAELAQLDSQHPVFGAYPTSRWAPGEMVIDAYAFALPPDVTPDGLTVILYRGQADGSFVNLDVARLMLP